jgi:hypothetical protein
MGEIEAVIRTKSMAGEIALPLEIGGEPLVADDAGGTEEV